MLGCLLDALQVTRIYSRYYIEIILHICGPFQASMMPMCEEREDGIHLWMHYILRVYNIRVDLNAQCCCRFLAVLIQALQDRLTIGEAAANNSLCSLTLAHATNMKHTTTYGLY